MVKCPEEARPHFEYSVTELLTTINQAKLLAGYFGRKSTAKLDVTIEVGVDFKSFTHNVILFVEVLMAC